MDSPFNRLLLKNDRFRSYYINVQTHNMPNAKVPTVNMPNAKVPTVNIPIFEKKSRCRPVKVSNKQIVELML
jgi:hypothetical protein